MKKLISLFMCFVLLGNLLAASVSAVNSDERQEAAEPDEASDGLPFTDVAESDWFYDAVSSMYAQGIIYGTSDTEFSPEEATTRAMAVVVLYRLDGEPEAGSCSFVDVRESDYFAAAVAWASENGIVYGTDETHFSPDALVTREQLITFLFRYVQYKGSSATQRSNLNLYTDKSSISDYAVPGVRWAVSVGMISGRTDTKLVPGGTTTRCELAQMLSNLQTKVLSSDTVMHPETTTVPVLMFHSIDDEDTGDYSMTTEDFESVISMLSEAGYHSITMQQLVDYVDSDAELPENPIMLTFDDGYQNNLDNACPILQKYGFSAVISVVCCYVGKDSYNGESITPHFSFEAAAAWVPVTISIESHTDKMHMLRDYDDLSDGTRGVAKRDSETDQEYYNRLVTDFTNSYNMIADAITAPLALTYPYGIFTAESEAAAKQVGYRVTITTRYGVNAITRGNPSSLYLLSRVEIDHTYTADEFAEKLAALNYD